MLVHELHDCSRWASYGRDVSGGTAAAWMPSAGPRTLRSFCVAWLTDSRSV